MAIRGGTGFAPFGVLNSVPMKFPSSKAIYFMHQDTRKLVYIVDDDPDDRQVILDAFLEHTSQLDYVFIESGDELMNTLNSSDEADYPSLILLDLNMPGMLGMQALREVKAHPVFSKIPTIVLTTSTLASDRKLSYELGANCFLSKPNLYSELVEITRSITQVWFRNVLQPDPI